jgi:Na+-driven multidrug efflux pump
MEFENGRLFNGANFTIVLISTFLIFIFSQEILSYFNVSDQNNLSFYLKLASFIPLLFAINIPLQQLVLAFNLQKQYVNITIWISVFLVASIATTFSLWQLTGIFILLMITEAIVVILYLYTLRNKVFKKSIL